MINMYFPFFPVLNFFFVFFSEYLICRRLYSALMSSLFFSLYYGLALFRRFFLLKSGKIVKRLEKESILGFSQYPNDSDVQSLPSAPSYSCMVCKSKTKDKCSLCKTSICSPCFFHVDQDERLCYSCYQV